MLTDNDKALLLEQAKTSILYGLNHHSRNKVINKDVSLNISKIQSCFVTLYIRNKLRGCIGSLNASQALFKDVHDNAYAAAFEDPRFPKLTKDEFNTVDIEISILSTSEKIEFIDEQDLLSQLRVGIDGLIFEYKHHRATYLPSVWNMLPKQYLFLNSLKEKAGLKSTFWSTQVKCYRYTTETIK